MIEGCSHPLLPEVDAATEAYIKRFGEVPALTKGTIEEGLEALKEAVRTGKALPPMPPAPWETEEDE